MDTNQNSRSVKGKINFDDFFSVPFKLFKCIGVVFDGENEEPATKRDRIRKHLIDGFGYFAVVNIGLVFMIHINHVIRHYMIGFKFDDNMVSNILNMLYIPYLMFKNVCIIINRREIHAIIESFREKFPTSLVDQQTHEIESLHRKFIIFCRILYSMSIAGASMFILSGISTFMTYGTEKFAANIYVPINHESLAVYLPIFIWFASVPIYTYITQCANDVIFTLIIMTLSLEFEILKIDLKKLLNDENSSPDDFKNFIIRHNELIDLTNRIQKVFSPTLLYVFIHSSIMFCLAGFVAIATSGMTRNTFIIPGIFMILYIFLPFFCGQRLSDASFDMMNAINDANWHEIKDVKMKKYLTLIIMQVERGKVLNGCGFVAINYETFGKAVMTAYSYFSFIMHMYD